MIKKTSEEHPELYHYTTGVGLQGIIQTQQLRATNIAYLNDVEEHVGWFDRRLPVLIDKPVRHALSRLSERPGRKAKIQAAGGIEAMVAKIKADLLKSVRKVALDLNDPYITAFCSAKAHANDKDGLLSQWRGYGVDGGYAIVFRTKELEDLVQPEIDNFAYQFAAFGDVDYYDHESDRISPHPERSSWEAEIQEGTEEALLSEDSKVRGKVFNAMSALSCRCKHHGFQRGGRSPNCRHPDPRPRVREGSAERQAGAEETSAVPTPEMAFSCRTSCFSVLQAQIEAKVVVSNIPYLGR